MQSHYLNLYQFFCSNPIALTMELLQSCTKPLTYVSKHQAIIWTNAGLLPIGTNFYEIWIKMLKFSFKQMYLKMSSAELRPFCLVLGIFGFIRRVTAGMRGKINEEINYGSLTRNSKANIEKIWSCIDALATKYEFTTAVKWTYLSKSFEKHFDNKQNPYQHI